MASRLGSRSGTAALVMSACLLVAPSLVTASEGGPQPADVASVRSADWRQVSTGGAHTCAVRTSGRLYCWGLDQYGQLGNGGGSTDVSTPVEVAGGSTKWSSVGAGTHHTCALKTTGRLYCWGATTGTTLPTSQVPVEVAGGSTSWASVNVGESVTCARKTNGRLFCWGEDDHGQLGNGGANTNSPVPVQVSGGATDWASVSPGAKHTCALKTSGRLYCWGRDDSGELGNGNTTTTDQTVPDQVAGRRTDWASVAAGTSHTCARTTSHRLYCWGADFFGQLGNGPDVSGNQPVPVEVAGGGTRWGALDGGESHTCARKTNGRLYCWGEDRYGRLGDGGGETNAEAPVQVAGATRDWGRVSAGMDQTCARKTTDRLYCWGKDGNGQLGDGGTNDNQSAPSEVIG